MPTEKKLPDFLSSGPSDASLTLLLAHGAGAPMDSPFMNAFAEGLASDAVRVVRFEFPYMAARREGKRKGPDRSPVLLQTWRDVIDAHGGGANVAIGGKSMGGRIASMVADEMGVRGLLCLGYPFHPRKKFEQLRIEHLKNLATPTLILQGTRDPLGGIDEVLGYGLPCEIHWLEDGDHDLKPRKSSGRTQEENWQEAIDAGRTFLKTLDR